MPAPPMDEPEPVTLYVDQVPVAHPTTEWDAIEVEQFLASASAGKRSLSLIHA